MNFTVFFLIQNLYSYGKQFRTISLNAHQFFLFNSPRDLLQIKIFAKQCFPLETNYFMDSYKRAVTNRKYGYLVVDLSPSLSEEESQYRLRTNILPGETTIVFLPLEKYIHESSGWILQSVRLLNIHTVSYKPLKGSSFIELPTNLKQCGAILNIENNHNKCFLWSILGHFYSVLIQPENVEHYIPYETKIDMRGIPYPVSLAKIDKFERQNDTISVNVFGFENNEIYPLRITKLKGKKHVNLLYLQEGVYTHYCLIRDLNRFLHRANRTGAKKRYYCPYCLNGFTSEVVLNKHLEFCATKGEQKIVLPEKGKGDVLKFRDYRKQMKSPFIIFCDFETLNREISTCSPDPQKSSTTSKKRLDVCSYGYKRVCSVDPRYTKDTIIYRGPDASQHFVESLLREKRK